jgi:hypothetical protein
MMDLNLTSMAIIKKTHYKKCIIEQQFIDACNLKKKQINPKTQ